MRLKDMQDNIIEAIWEVIRDEYSPSFKHVIVGRLRPQVGRALLKLAEPVSNHSFFTEYEEKRVTFKVLGLPKGKEKQHADGE